MNTSIIFRRALHRARYRRNGGSAAREKITKGKPYCRNPDELIQRLRRELAATWDHGVAWRLAREITRSGGDEFDVVPILDRIPGVRYYGVVEHLASDSSVGLERWDHPVYGSIFVKGYWEPTEPEPRDIDGNPNPMRRRRKR